MQAKVQATAQDNTKKAQESSAQDNTMYIGELRSRRRRKAEEKLTEETKAQESQAQGV